MEGGGEVRGEPTRVLHVTPDGADSGEGTAEQPLASLSGARDRIRAWREAGACGGIEVKLHAGTYVVEETVRFETEDLGDVKTPIRYVAAGDGEVRLIGGPRLRGFEPHEGPVLKLDLAKAGMSGALFGQLLYDGDAQPQARYPSADPADPYGSGWLYVEGPEVDMYEAGHGEKDRFICKDPRLAAWSRIEEVELFVYPRFNYTNQIVRLQSYDRATGEIVLAEPTQFEIYPGDRFYFRNVKEELNAPGEWYVDHVTDTLYFYPPAAVDFGEVEVVISQVEHLIELRGEDPQTEDLYAEKVDWHEGGGYIRLAERPPARDERGHLRFEGLTLEGCGGAAVVMRHVTCCEVVGCTIRHTGGPGAIVLKGWECRVADNDIHDTGSHGIYMSGGIRSPFAGRYMSCRHEAVNNYIHHFGKVYKSATGVGLNGVGIRVAHNLIHDGPRTGILSRGNDHLIEYNHIRHVNAETSDSSAINLVDRDLTMRGTKIHYNRIHDILGYHKEDGVWTSPAFAFGIYLDDFTSGVEVKGNLVYRTPGGGLYIHAGQDHLIENNFFLEATKELAKFRRWREEIEYRTLGTHGIGLRRNVVRRNVFASTQAETFMYRFDTSCDIKGRLDLETNQWEHNLFWHFDQPVHWRVSHRELEQQLTLEEWLDYGLEHGSQVGDPLFRDYGGEQFDLESESPAHELGIEALPLEQMGPQASPTRASWPIVEADGVRESMKRRSES